MEQTVHNQSRDVQQKAPENSDGRRLPSWREMNWDTSPETENVLLKLWREAPAWRKLELMEDLNRTARQLSLMGLRRRLPNASTDELRRHLAAIALGEELAARVYGPVPG